MTGVTCNAHRMPRTIAVVLVAGLLSGCSYQVLSFFFTGVPDPNSAPPAIAAEPDQLTEEQSLHPLAIAPQKEYLHGPWAARQCDLCHVGGGSRRAGAIKPSANNVSQLAFGQSELCLGCHDRPLDKAAADNPWFHAPVASGECIACHSPHKSANAFMVIWESSRTLCEGCHDQAFTKTRTHHGEDPNQECLDCHNPHAGDKSTLLKARVDQ